jgi:hypothetical protein
VLSAGLGLNRYLRVTPGGLLRTGAVAIKAEENLDGKYLLRCSDPKMTTEDIALGYKQLLEVERDWRDLKQVIDLRPVYHRKEERIRAHVILCWLALLLIRIAETTASTIWAKITDELDLLTLGTFTGPAGTSRQAELTRTQRNLLAKLKAPKKIIEATHRCRSAGKLSAKAALRGVSGPPGSRQSSNSTGPRAARLSASV